MEDMKYTAIGCWVNPNPAMHLLYWQNRCGARETLDVAVV